jgi:hypothetical protein
MDGLKTHPYQPGNFLMRLESSLKARRTFAAEISERRFTGDKWIPTSPRFYWHFCGPTQVVPFYKALI